MDSHVNELLQEGEPFWVLLVCVRNLKPLEKRYSRTILEGTLKAFLQRFSAMLDKHAVIGRWDEQNFAAILEMKPGAALSMSRAATKKLSGDYTVQENGLSQIVPLQASAGVINCSGKGDETSFQEKLVQMSQALREA
jgi:GGDEF domain-containing protein